VTDPPRDWEWIELEAVLDAHTAQLATYGGLPGIRDQGALESALGRPMNIAHYQPEAEVIRMFLLLAEGRVSLDDLAQWFRTHSGLN
jgi:prophage maintenance system killer protein